MAATTERQRVVKHFQDKKETFKAPVDLALALRADQVGPRELADDAEYVQKALKAGYKSPMFKDLFDAVNGSAKTETK